MAEVWRLARKQRVSSKAVRQTFQSIHAGFRGLNGCGPYCDSVSIGAVCYTEEDGVRLCELAALIRVRWAQVVAWGEGITMGSIQRAWKVVREFRREYIVLNVVYYGLVVCGMVYVLFDPSPQQSLSEAVGRAFTEGPLSTLVGAYRGGQVLLAIVLTFVVNLIGGSFAVITIPSLLIPFIGLLVGAVRAVLWGLILSPTSTELAKPMIAHSLTLILEGQGYILAMLAVYIHGKSFLWPRTVGATTRGEGYRAGVKRSAQIYLFVVLLLAVAAVYEALEVIYIVPRLS